MDWNRLADDASLEKTAMALREKGMDVVVVKNRTEAKAKALDLISPGSEVLALTSVTLEETGIAKEIESGGRCVSVRRKITSINDKAERERMRRIGSASDCAIGSVHAVTEEGQVVIASQSGSNLSPYAFSAARVIWVVGTQKIVKNLDDAFRRLREHCLPLEDARAKKAYGVGSSINKILVVEKEISPNRISMILVSEKLGF